MSEGKRRLFATLSTPLDGVYNKFNHAILIVIFFFQAKKRNYLKIKKILK